MSLTFGEKFTLMIDLVDVKQKELANHIGVHASLISKCKKGERQLPRSSFEKIPEALKEMGKWREEYDEPWAELWLMYLQETGADAAFFRQGAFAQKAEQGPDIAHEQAAISTKNVSVKDVTTKDVTTVESTSGKFASTDESKQSETSASPKQVMSVEVDTAQRELISSETGLLTPPDTIQRLSALLKEPYSVVAILLFIVIALFARGTSLLPNPGALLSFGEPKQSGIPDEFITSVSDSDSESESGTMPDPTSAPLEKQTISENAVTSISPNTKVMWDFEAGLGGWIAYSEPDAEHSIDIDNGRLCSEIVSPGKAPWDLTMRHNDISLSAENVYQLVFDVTTAVDRNLSISLLAGNRIYIYSTHPLKAGPQSVEIDIYQNVGDAGADLVFWVGGQPAGKVCMDNIVLSAVGTFEPSLDNEETRSDTMGNLIPSADFSEGYYAKGWWLYEDNDAALDISVRDGALCATVREPGNAITDLTIGRRGIDLVNGTDYQLDFDVFSDGIDSLQLYISNYFETLELAPDWSVATMQYSHTEDSPNKGIRLRFGGQPNGTLCVDNFLLVESD